MLSYRTSIPTGLISITAANLHTLFSGPTLIYISGKKKPPLFISCLIHGNETTGLIIIQRLIKQYAESPWPRDVYLFFGNISAAAANLRHLPDQIDYNRIWTGGETPEHLMANEIYDIIKKTGLFAAIDIHNNTGRNPCYSCIESLAPQILSLAAFYAEQSLFDQQPLGTLSEGFSRHWPSLTLEAGRVGEVSAIERVWSFVQTVLTWDKIPEPNTAPTLNILESVGTLKIPSENTVSLLPGQADFVFDANLDLLNFTEVKPGTVLAQVRDGCRFFLLDNNGHDVADKYIFYQNNQGHNQAIVSCAFVPAMITLNLDIIKSDCLGYVLTPSSPIRKLYKF